MDMGTSILKNFIKELGEVTLGSSIFGVSEGTDEPVVRQPPTHLEQPLDDIFIEDFGYRWWVVNSVPVSRLVLEQLFLYCSRSSITSYCSKDKSVKGIRLYGFLEEALVAWNSNNIITFGTTKDLSDIVCIIADDVNRSIYQNVLITHNMFGEAADFLSRRPDGWVQIPDDGKMHMFKLSFDKSFISYKEGGAVWDKKILVTPTNPSPVFLYLLIAMRSDPTPSQEEVARQEAPENVAQTLVAYMNKHHFSMDPNTGNEVKRLLELSGLDTNQLLNTLHNIDR